MDGGDYDAIILGHGIAGATLAWHLHWRGWRFLIADRDEPFTSSRVAAGIVTPISGRRIARSWRVDEFLPAARAFYDRAAGDLGITHYHQVPYVRIFRTDDEKRRWQQKRSDPAFLSLLTEPQPAPLADPAAFHDASDGFEMHSAWLDVRAWLLASRRFHEARGRWLTADIPADAVSADSDAVCVRHPQPLRARHLIFCQGFEAARNPFFPWLRWKSAKGEILNLQAPGLTEHRITNGGAWLLPFGAGHFRAGSTYAWDDFTTTPTAAAREDIESRLRRTLRVPFTVTSHEAAVRPIINESKAVIGLHPVHRRLAFFNGLGSKGVLHAPFFASQLAAQIIDGSPVEYAVDVCRN